jgi:hypothetical protein
MALPVPTPITTGFSDAGGSAFRLATNQLIVTDSGAGTISAVNVHSFAKVVLGTGYNAPHRAEQRRHPCLRGGKPRHAAARHPRRRQPRRRGRGGVRPQRHRPGRARRGTRLRLRGRIHRGPRAPRRPWDRRHHGGGDAVERATRRVANRRCAFPLCERRFRKNHRVRPFDQHSRHRRQRSCGAAPSHLGGRRQQRHSGPGAQPRRCRDGGGSLRLARDRGGDHRSDAAGALQRRDLVARQALACPWRRRRHRSPAPAARGYPGRVRITTRSRTLPPCRCGRPSPHGAPQARPRPRFRPTGAAP